MKGPDEGIGSSIARRFAITFLATYGLLVLVAGLDQIRAPFFHFDDASALFGAADAYYIKAVSEGRWFNYLWHLREFRFSSVVNFQLYFIGWAVFVAASGVSLFRSGGVHVPIAFGLLVALGPQTTQMSGWFNTAIPGIWLLAAFAVLTLAVTERAGRWLMAACVPIAIQAYTPYPFLLLALCLLREDGPRSLKSIAWVVAAFLGALAFGIIAVQMMNLAIAGVFDIELQTWRNPTPARDLAGLVANVPKVWVSMVDLYHSTGFGHPGLSLAIATLFCVSLVIVARKAWHEALGVGLVIGAGLGSLVAYSLLEGIELPFRSTGFLWFVMAFTIVRAASMVSQDRWLISGLAVALGLALAGVLTIPVAQEFRAKSEWQSYVRSMLAEMPDTASRIYIYGSLDDVPRSTVTASDHDLTMKLHAMSGIVATDCALVPEDCREFGAPFGSQRNGDVTRVRMAGDAALILPARWHSSE